MISLTFWAEPAVITTDEATITVGAGEVDGGRHDGAERVAVVIHTRSADGNIIHGWAHLTAAQVAELIESLSGARAALALDTPTIGGVE
ncbi:hypothetical protein [Nocardia farcinica]|uniref:Uncharacterized protein n=1 Tax=Nocardia farcinica (strain IFM 10152) TaxID=247156 RepID=Q5Z3Y5_NOCFA|nr:hypothetical protein [Nocardia farcinica]BAD54856.1 hypothetical protein NFA_140 [Nocardia farcinica IFM 10152]